MPTTDFVTTGAMRRVFGIAIVALACGAVGAAQPFRLSPEDFPNTGFPDAGLGEPYIVIYDDGDFLASASYRYSQRNHDSPWLVVTLRIARSERVWRNLEIRREDIVLVRPDGTEVPPATQRERRDDREGLRRLLNERVNWPETVRFDFLDFPEKRTRGGYYFLQRALRFQDPGVRRFEESGDRFGTPRGVSNDVFFVSPDKSWEAGVHALDVTVDDDRLIRLPVWLR